MRALLGKVKYEIVIFTILMIEMIQRMPSPSEMHDFCTTPYALSYRLGFGSRLLIGSIISLFSSYLSSYLVYLFILISIIMLSMLVSSSLGRIIKKSEKQTSLALAVLTLLFMASPASISFLFYFGNYGRFDTYIILLVIIALLAMHNNKTVYWVPVICFIGMAIHQVFAFTYFILIMGTLVYEVYRQQYKKSTFVIAGATLFIAVASFTYFQFLSPPLNTGSLTELVEQLAKKTDIPISVKMLEYEYFADISLQWRELIVPGWKGRLLTGLVIIILVSPLSILLISIWKNAIRYVTDKTLKIILIMMMLAPITAIPAFLLTIDWGRWFASIFIVQFGFIFYLAYHGCSAMLKALVILGDWFHRNRVISLSMLLYLAALGKFEAAAQLNLAAKIVNYTINLVH